MGGNHHTSPQPKAHQQGTAWSKAGEVEHEGGWEKRVRVLVLGSLASLVWLVYCLVNLLSVYCQCQSVGQHWHHSQPSLFPDTILGMP